MCCGLPNLGRRSSVAEKKQGICRVCELADFDISLKLVEHCNLCNAWICDECKPKLFKRGWAALLELIS